MKRPLLSVLVPAFDYGHYLRECLESVLAQSVEDIEVVIGDNASNDDTPDIAGEFVRSDMRFAYYRHPTNIGYARNFNSLLAQARGHYVTVLGSDDRYVEKDFLATATATLADHPWASFFHTAYQEVDAVGHETRLIRYYDKESVEPGRQALLQLLGLRYPWISSVVVPNSVVRRVGGFDLDYEYAWDLAWFWKLALAGDVAYSPRAMVTYRRHDVSLSGSPDEGYKRRHVLAALERFRPEIAPLPELVEACDRSRRLLEHHLSGDFDQVEGDPDTRLATQLDRWRASGLRVLVYGAGMHTRLLWERHDFRDLNLVGFADRDPAYRHERFQGLPIVAPNEIEGTRAQVVLVSSRFYEDEIVRELRSILPLTIALQRIYGVDLPVDGTALSRL